ncbi:hypothetical protein [Ruania zhangjianzhongii]|uniref:hypothetical protein n=1 Tax=Ruania zhangjianzhongii TaxID=2603206 RepID=UPI0011C878CC|nr:hypothetical protein [Ruania zhangjianzhongii]
MSDAVEVELSALTGGCSELQGIRGGFGDILEAANVSNGLAPLSFGILCSFFTPPAQLVQGIEIAALKRTGPGHREDCPGSRAVPHRLCAGG